MTTSHAYEQALDAALEFLGGEQRLLVVSHVNPDGDAISSTLVVGWLLDKLGKQYTMVNMDELPSKLSFLAHNDRIEIGIPDETYSAVVAVDCADYKRMGAIVDCFAQDVRILNIDHHATNNGYGTINIVRPEAAATVEVLFDLLERMNCEIDLPCATALYTGLLTDTGGFRYSNTSPRVMEIAARLLAIGVSGSYLADHLLEKMSKNKLRLLQLSLSRLAFACDDKISWLYVQQADVESSSAMNEELEGIVNYALNVEGVEVGLLFKETEQGQVKVSFRSAGKVDVAAVAQQFGGGGHVRAAGCRLECTLDDAMKKVVAAVEGALS